ncbi:MAG: hypothetical protein HN467_11310 [Opitutae bacterium]|nr:hypothetical protein [Opitutae bacterium]
MSHDIFQLISQAQQIGCNLEKANISAEGGLHIHPAYLAKILCLTVAESVEENQNLNNLLNDIHTETTPNERKFLLSFFKRIWDGQDNVLEIGPFLGGSTRAIALGMMLNPNKKNIARVYTYDRFGKYHKPEELLHFLAPMFERGILGETEKQFILKNNSFLEVFDIIHRQFEYYRMIVPQRAILNDIPPDQDSDNEASFRFEQDQVTPFNLPEELTYSAVFVDGCKSWYGTKQFMQITLPKTSKGCYYIFQDYGTHTCFWLPVFLQVFNKYFKLVAFVDHTYTFELVEELSQETISKNFPDSPADIPRSEYELLFKKLQASAINFNDTYSVLNYQLQYAGLLGYLGYRDEARSLIVKQLNSPFALTHRQWILRALEWSTYDSQGNNIDLFLPKEI